MTHHGRNRGHLFLVADGMGGHLAGEVASAVTVATIESFVLQVNRSLYMVEKSGQRLPGFQAFAAVVQHALMQLIARATG
jgi:serine/threonine protein phosphatase PrpC